jgi:hypothetical protein
MGTRIKTFDSTGVAPGGKLYAGDLNAMQDQYADQANFAQTIDLGTVRIGEAGLSLSKFAVNEARLTGALRIDKQLGLGSLTTTQRNALTSPPTGTMIYNSTTGQVEVNLGSAGTPSWVVAGIGTDIISAGLIAPNSIGASELADNAVDTAAIAAGAAILGKYVLQYACAVASFTYSASDMASRAYAPGTSYSENDPNGWFSSSTQFIVPTTGTYLIAGTIDNMSAGSGRYKNGFIANPSGSALELPGGNTASVHFAGDNLKGMPPAIVMASLTAGDQINHYGFSENGGTARHQMMVFRLV